MTNEVTLLDEIKADYQKANETKKETKEIVEVKKKRGINFRIVVLGFFVTSSVVVLGGIGVATVAKKVTDWGAEHQFVKQPIFYAPKFDWPYRIEKRYKEPVTQIVVANITEKELKPIEKKIIDKWGFKDGVVALAVFDCGESGLDPYAVSPTGDLGVAQIHWPTWKKFAGERFGYTAPDMFDVDKNLNMAYVVWDRGDGKEGNGEGSWGDGKNSGWMGFNNQSYLRCFNK